MEGGSSLFNPGFLGGSFLWWVGQIADDLTWRKNKNPGKFTSPSNIRGWGERYNCLLYTSPSPRDGLLSRMPSSA